MRRFAPTLLHVCVGCKFYLPISLGRKDNRPGVLRLCHCRAYQAESPVAAMYVCPFWHRAALVLYFSETAGMAHRTAGRYVGGGVDPRALAFAQLRFAGNQIRSKAASSSELTVNYCRPSAHSARSTGISSDEPAASISICAVSDSRWIPVATLSRSLLGSRGLLPGKSPSPTNIAYAFDLRRVAPLQSKRYPVIHDIESLRSYYPTLLSKSQYRYRAQCRDFVNPPGFLFDIRRPYPLPEKTTTSP